MCRTMMSGTLQCTGSAAGALFETLGMDLPLSESDEGRSVLTFDKRHFPLPGNMLFIFPTTRLPPGRPCHPRTTTLLRPSFGSGPVYRPDLGWGQHPPRATTPGQKFLPKSFIGVLACKGWRPFTPMHRPPSTP